MAVHVQGKSGGKERLCMEDVVRLYEYEPNRAGFVTCPFHAEETASLKIYPGSRGWYCFGCHKGGSVIDFTSELFGLSPLDAVRKLNQDFHLGLPLDHKPDAAERREVQERRKTDAVYGPQGRNDVGAKFGKGTANANKSLSQTAEALNPSKLKEVHTMSIDMMNAKAAAYFDLMEQIEQLTEEAEAIKDVLKGQMLEQATEVLEGAGWRATWHNTNNSRFDTKRFRADHADLYGQYTVKSTGTRFTLNKVSA